MIAECPNNEDWISTNREKNSEIYSPNIWLNNIGLKINIPELVRFEFLKFQSLLTSHKSLNKPIMSFDEM
jgi:hypothetical protein